MFYKKKNHSGQIFVGASCHIVVNFNTILYIKKRKHLRLAIRLWSEFV